MLQRIVRVRTRFVLVAAAALILLMLFVSSSSRSNLLSGADSILSGSGSNSDIPSKPIVGKTPPKESHQFWTNIFDIFAENEISFTKEELEASIKYISGDKQVKNDFNTKDLLLSKADISDDLVSQLQTSHRNVLAKMPAKLSQSTYTKGSYGVVVIGGGKFSWLAYLSILALRETGSNIAVEVIMPSFSDYEKEIQFCQKTLADLNASCVMVPDILGAEVMLNWSSKLSSYQFKSLALIASTFQNILLLDSDNIILSKPEGVFQSELYKKTGMITWPDYWPRTTSPKFYDVAGLKVNEGNRIRINKYPLRKTEPEDAGTADFAFHDFEGAIPDYSTESGQLFINKGTHGQTLLLSLYYNVYGPKLYYKLLSLGAPGEGDKDTFVTAAEITKEPYYQVKSFIKTFGYADNKGKFHGVAMGQKNPVVDHSSFLKHVVNNKDLDGKSVDEQIKVLKSVDNEVFDTKSVIPLFAVHCNFPKQDPVDLMKKDDLYSKEDHKLKYRMYGDLKFERNSTDVNNHVTSKTIDFELQQWTLIHKALCVKQLKFTHFASSDMEDMCLFAKNQVDWLKESTTVKA